MGYVAARRVLGRAKTVILKRVVWFSLLLGAVFGVQSNRGKPTSGPKWPRARRLLSYVASMAGGFVAYVGNVASQCVAMSAIWHPK